MKIRFRNERRSRIAHLERRIALNVPGADPYAPDEPETSDDLVLVEASRGERAALRKAGFTIPDARRIRRAA